MKLSTYLTIERNDIEIDLTITGHFYPGCEGKLNGPPEDCFPPEPADAEIETISFDGKPWEGKLTADEEKQAIENLISTAEDY